MLSKKSHPFPRHQASTRFLRVPAADWPAVRLGAKTEFRTRPRESSRLLSCNVPTPVVAYTTSTLGWPDIKSQLMVLEDRRYEPLFNIAEDEGALAREGFESYDHFRRYWRKRNAGRYVPMQRVWVWRVRRFEPGDLQALGARLLTDLYGEHL